MERLSEAMNNHEIMATDRLQGINYERMRQYRLNRTKEMMKKYGIGTMVTWDGWDMRYIASAYATIPCRWYEGQFVILPVNGEPHVYGQTSFSYQAMRSEMPWLKDKIFNSPGSTKMVNTVERLDKIIDIIEAVVRDHGLADMPIGLDGCTSEFLVGEALARRGLKAVDGKHTMFMARMIKNEDEVSCVRMACACAEAAFSDIKTALKPGVKECELVGIGMNRLYALGCDETQEFVCASGRRTNPLHVDFTDRIIRPGDVVAIDINGASWQGYKSCYYRTFVCGQSNSEIDEVYEKARVMMYDAMKYIKAGAPVNDPIKGFPDSPKYWGYDKIEEVASYAVGHGLGISLHEQPFISYLIPPPEEVPVFEEGMVLAMETWVGNDAGTFGVRLEENLVVTKNGYELLTFWPVDKITECPL